MMFPCNEFPRGYNCAARTYDYVKFIILNLLHTTVHNVHKPFHFLTCSISVLFVSRESLSFLSKSKHSKYNYFIHIYLQKIFTTVV